MDRDELVEEKVRLTRMIEALPDVEDDKAQAEIDVLQLRLAYVKEEIGTAHGPAPSKRFKLTWTTCARSAALHYPKRWQACCVGWTTHLREQRSPGNEEKKAPLSRAQL